MLVITCRSTLHVKHLLNSGLSILLLRRTFRFFNYYNEPFNVAACSLIIIKKAATVIQSRQTAFYKGNEDSMYILVPVEPHFLVAYDR